MDVIRDSAIVALNQANVRALDVNLEATNDRFEVGDLTRTDIAQSESRLAVARSDLRTAEAQLISSRENYVRLVGDTPDDLAPPPPLPNLPVRSEEHTSELQSLMRISYAVFCLKKKNSNTNYKK